MKTADKRFFPFHHVLFFFLVVHSGAASFAPCSTSAETTTGEVLFWQEEIPKEQDEKKLQNGSSSKKKQRNRKIWGTWRDAVPSTPWDEELLVRRLLREEQEKRSKEAKKKKKRKIHPLRTDQWELTFESRRRSLFPSGKVIVDFSTNGYVRVDKFVGKWERLYTGLRWTVPILVEKDALVPKPPGTKQPSDVPDLVEAALLAFYRNGTPKNHRSTYLRYHADLHINPFGQQPHMVRGIVTRDRLENSWLPWNWFRPVVGTFTAVGIGDDLADFSYSERTQ